MKNKWEEIIKPPDTNLYYFFYAEKFSFEYARNILLNFLKEKNLSEECLNWVNEFYIE